MISPGNQTSRNLDTPSIRDVRVSFFIWQPGSLKVCYYHSTKTNSPSRTNSSPCLISAKIDAHPSPLSPRPWRKMTVAVCFPLDFFIVGAFLKVSLIFCLVFSAPGFSDGLNMMVRVCSIFEFQVGNSNQGTTDQKWYFVTKIVLTYCEKKLLQ